MRWIVCLLVFGPLVESMRYDGYHSFRAVPKDIKQLKLVAGIQDNSYQSKIVFVNEAHDVNNEVEFLVPPHSVIWTIKQLQVGSIPFNITSTDVQKLFDEENVVNEAAKQRSKTRTGIWGGDDEFDYILDAYQRHSDINFWLDTIAYGYSNMASVISIGKTYEGRDMKVMKISTGGKKPALWVDGGIHAREWIAPATAIYVIHKLLTQYGVEQAVTDLVDRYDWYILPVANPDGYEYSHSNNRMWRKTRSPTTVRGCIGADPNRNFDAYWNTAGTSPNPCSDTYAGSKPFSETNTQNMRDAINSLKDRLVMYWSFHSFGQMWLTPYGYSRQRPSDYVEMDRVAAIGAAELSKYYGMKYRIGTPPAILYAAAGGSYDWAKLKAGVKYSYTLELRPSKANCGWRCNGFVLNPSNIKPNSKEVFYAMAASIRAIKI